MRQILRNIYLLKECKLAEPTSAIYLLNTESDDGLILIDTGLGFDFKKDMKKTRFKASDIKHCLLTHGHLDHVDGCKELMKINPNILFYCHENDKEAIESLVNKNTDLHFTISEVFKKKSTDLTLGPFEFKCLHVPGHSPGGMVYVLKIENQLVLFSGDICGGGIKSHSGNHEAFKNSLKQLLNLKADVLCEGHMNVIQPSEEVSKFIEGCQKINEYVHVGFDLDHKDAINWYNLAFVSFQLKLYDNAYGACKYSLKLDPENIEAKRLMEKMEKLNLPRFESMEKYFVD